MTTTLLLTLFAACQRADVPADDPAPAVPSGPYGPENSWYHADAADVPAPPASARFAEGELVPDLWMPDQNGDIVSIYQFTGKLLLVETFDAREIPKCA